MDEAKLRETGTPLSHVTVRRVLTGRAAAGVNGRGQDVMLLTWCLIHPN
jgi:hypothetical protein